MTTIVDLLNNIIQEAKEIKEKAAERQAMQLDDDMQPLDEIEEEITEELIEEYSHTLKVRFLGL